MHLYDSSRKDVRDFLNDVDSEEELMNHFDLQRCEHCDGVNLSEDLYDTSYGTVCLSCLEDCKEYGDVDKIIDSMKEEAM